MYCQPVLVITLAALWTNCHKSTISCDWMELMVRHSLQLHNRTKRMYVIMHFSSWTDPERKKMQREGCEIEFQIGPCNMLSETATWNGHVPVCSFRHCARRVCDWTAAARRQIKVWREIYIPGGPPLFLSPPLGNICISARFNLFSPLTTQCGRVARWNRVWIANKVQSPLNPAWKMEFT